MKPDVIRFDDLDKGLIGTPHLVRWCGAIENFHRIHYDQPFAKGHEGLPDVIINGSWMQHLFVEYVNRATSRKLPIVSLEYTFKQTAQVNSRIVVRGARADPWQGDEGYVLDLCIEANGVTVATGRAVVGSPN